MKLNDKLDALIALDDLALLKWTGSFRVVGGRYIPLSEVRLIIIAVHDGAVYYTSAAAAVYNVYGRSRYRFFDDNMLKVLSGPRANINTLKAHVHSDEEFAILKNCMHCEVTTDSPNNIAKQVIDMGLAPCYPAWGIPIPDMYRLTQAPDTLRPLYSKKLLQLIGGTPEDTADELHTKFKNNLHLLGVPTDSGYAIRDDWVASGGMLCMTSNGITKSRGSCVYRMPYKLLLAELAALNWPLHVGQSEEYVNEFMDSQDTATSE